jgi:hypothetical protein
MGVIATYLANAKVIDGADAKGTLRLARMELLQLAAEFGDPDFTTVMAARDQVSTVTFNASISSGNYTLTINRWDGGESFTTANILYTSNAAQIEGIIDTAATGNITGWTNGDISVAGGDIATANIALTFDGTSVTSNGYTVTTANVDLGGGVPGAVVSTANGQANREPWGVMYAGRLITNAVPIRGQATGYTTINLHDNNGPFRISNPTALLLARDAAIQDGNDDIFTNLVASWDIPV